jgi:hypothetical protein
MSDTNVPPEDGAPTPPDVRRTVHEDMGVRVERDLTNSSDWLARGSKTHFSKIKFHSVGRSHAEAQAPVPPVSAPPSAATEPTRGTPSIPAPVATSSAPEPATVPAPTPAPGLLDRIKSLFGL